MNSTTRYFCNEGEHLLLTNSVEISVQDDGFALLAPYGDTRYELSDGAGGTRTVIQRITKETATTMVNTFQSVKARVLRWFRGAPIYAGHPDEPGISRRYPDKGVKGLFTELQVRPDGLYVRPIFNNDGAALLESGKKLFFSGRWPAKQTGTFNGLEVWEPFDVTSIGMTPNPNLPTELLNDNTAGDGATATNEESIMDKKKLIQVLIAAGLASLNNEASEEQITAGIAQLGANAAKATTLANEKSTADAALTAKDAEITRLTKAATDASTQFANERKTLIDALLTDRQKAGFITEAERKVWEGRLTANFTNEFPEFNKLPKKLNTEGHPGVSGDRREVSEPAKAAQKLVELTNERIKSTGKSFQAAATEINAENPELVEAAFGQPKK